MCSPSLVDFCSVVFSVVKQVPGWRQSACWRCTFLVDSVFWTFVLSLFENISHGCQEKLHNSSYFNIPAISGKQPITEGHHTCSGCGPPRAHNPARHAPLKPEHSLSSHRPVQIGLFRSFLLFSQSSRFHVNSI